jgi:large subunit ribosomal protein L22
MRVRAVARDVRISPLKVRLVVDAVRGKRVGEAEPLLRFLPSPAARAVAKVIKSATANAENNFGMDPKRLKIVEIFVDEGHRLKRMRAQARGRVNPILKRSCHITVLVEEEA